MKQTNNIPQGYKDSPLGIIPKEWEVKKLGTIFEPVNSFSFSREQMTNQPQKLRYIHYGDIHTSNEKESVNLINEELPFILDGLIPNEKLESETFPFLKNGDILLADASEDYEGVGSLWELLNIANRKVIAGLHTIVLRDKKNDIAIGYGRYILKNPKSAKSLKRIAQGTKVYSINYKYISKLDILIPPLPEQQKIAEILSVWDEAIEKQTQLIVQLETRKRGLMQQLLTGKKRLKGFDEKWKLVKVKEVFSEISESNDNNSHTVMTISARQGLISQKDKFDRIIAGESLGKYTLIQKDDFAYNKGNSNLYEMGCIYQLENISSALVPFVYICFRPTNKVFSKFYKHWFANHGLDRQLKKIITSGARGDGLLNVNKSDFFTLLLPYPSIEEQTAIANILSTADNEINLAKQKLATLKEQKKGLMQQLLTGKKRVRI